MKKVARLSLSLRKALANPATRLAKNRALVACAVLISCSTLASASGPSIQQLFSFPCPPQQFGNCPEGYAPNVLIQASDGNFYGAAQLTTEGTSNPQGGTLFKITPSGQFTLLFTFAHDKNGNYVNGDNPATSLVEANDGFLYGTTVDGGATNNGVLFRIGKNGQGFQVVHNFCSAANCADGNGPGSLILGHDGNLYGVTFAGGNSTGNCFGGCGTIFRFTPPSKLTTLLALDGSSQGFSPGGLVQGTDGNIYGTAGSIVFRFTLSGKFTVLTTFPFANGFLPTSASSGLLQASNGKLYGALSSYSLDQAQFYQINPSGSGFHEFPAMGTLAVDFRISTPIQGSDGNSWTAFTERSEQNGAVFALSLSSGAVVHNFQFEGTNGSIPEAGVVQGADGKIYGTAALGGTVGGGQQASGTVWVLDAGLAPPVAGVAAFSPASGAAGTKVLIRGTHFIGTTAMTFNGVSATFTVLNTEFMSATVPVGATTGPIAVTNAAGTTVSTAHFTVP
jgi:uncharacterized repeat protein (TIGR03803 family)